MPFKANTKTKKENNNNNRQIFRLMECENQKADEELLAEKQLSKEEETKNGMMSSTSLYTHIYI